MGSKGSSGPRKAFVLVQMEARALAFVPQQAVPWKRVSASMRKLCVLEGKCQDGLSCETSMPSTVAAEGGVFGTREGIWWHPPMSNMLTYTEQDLLGYRELHGMEAQPEGATVRKDMAQWPLGFAV